MRDYFVWQCNEHEGMARPYVEVIRIKEEGRTAVLVVSCRHFKFNILVRYIFLLKIHSTQKHISISTYLKGQELVYQPHDPHQLSPHDRITPIRTDTQVEVDSGIHSRIDISDDQHSLVEIS